MTSRVLLMIMKPWSKKTSFLNPAQTINILFILLRTVISFWNIYSTVYTFVLFGPVSAPVSTEKRESSVD